MALSKKVVVLGDVGEEDVGRLAAEFQGGRNQVVGGGLGNHAAGGGRAGEGDLGDAAAGGERHAGFAAVTVDDVEHAGRQQVGDQPGQIRMLIGVDSAGLSTTQLPAPMAGASFQAAIRIGKFHGMIWPTTPSGSWKW
jgi:hypothetical protein